MDMKTEIEKLGPRRHVWYWAARRVGVTMKVARDYPGAYIRKYVRCYACKTEHTELELDTRTSGTIMVCDWCDTSHVADGDSFLIMSHAEEHLKLLHWVPAENRYDDLISLGRNRLYPPVVVQIGLKRTGWTNFGTICDRLKQDPAHVASFFFDEIRTTGMVTEQRLLLLKGDVGPESMARILDRYKSKLEV